MKTIAQKLEEEITHLKAADSPSGFKRAWLKECEALLEDDPRAQAQFARQLFSSQPILESP